MVDAGARNTTKQSAKNCLVPRKITDKRYSLAIPVYFPPLHPPPLFKQILCRLNRQHPGPVRTLPFSRCGWRETSGGGAGGGGKRDRGSVKR